MINRGKVLSLRKSKSLYLNTDKRLLIFDFLIFIIGIIISIIFSKKSSIINWNYICSYLYTGNIKIRYFAVLLKSFFFNILFVSVLFLLGTSAVGLFFVPLIVFIFGYFCGGISSYLFVTYGFKGIAFNTLIVIPSSIIFILVVLFAAKEAFCFSVKIANVILIKRNMNLFNEFRLLCKKFIVFIISVLGSSVIHMLLVKTLISFFKL